MNRFAAGLSRAHALALALTLALALPSQAQTYQDSGGTIVPGEVPIQPGVGPLFTSANPGKISGTFSATLSGFQPTPAYASLAAGASSARVALPSGTAIVVYNMGAYPACVVLGSVSVTASSSGANCTASDYIPANAWMGFTVGSATYLAAIDTSAGTTSLMLSGGAGLPTGAGGGGSAGGGTFSWPGTATVAVGGTSAGASTMPYVNAYLAAALPAGANTIGTVNLGTLNGAATAANQTTANGYLSTLAATGATALQAGAANNSGNPFYFSCVGGCGGNAGSGGSTPQATTQAEFNLSTATTTQIIAAAAGEFTYISYVDFFNSTASSTSSLGSVALEYGTQTSTPCDTGTAVFTPTFTLGPQSGKASGTGFGSIYTIPAGDQVCAVTSSFTSSPVIAVGVSYTQSTSAVSSFGGGGNAGFTPTPSYTTPLSVSGTSGRVAAPSGATVVIFNTGLNAAFTTIGNSSVTATASMDQVPAGGCWAYVQTGSQYIAGIETAGPTTLNISGGSGWPLGCGGGGSGGGTTSITPFTPNGNYVTATVGVTTAESALPAGGGTSVALYNVGTAPIRVEMGTSSAVTVTATTGDVIYPGGSIVVGVGSYSNIAYITPAGASQIAMSGGSGLGPSTGGNLATSALGSAIPNYATLGGMSVSGLNTAVPGTANGLKVDASGPSLTVVDPTVGSIAASVPSSAAYVGVNSGGNLTGIIQASASVPLNIATATTTQLVALSGSTAIYVTSYAIVAGGTGNITFEYGTGTNCGTGTTALTGALNLTAQAGATQGSGLGPILFVPAGKALCALTSAAVQMSGSVAYTQF